MTPPAPSPGRHQPAAPSPQDSDTRGASRGAPTGFSSSASPAWDTATEFIAAMLTWGAIGFGLDAWLETGPWLMLAGFFIGNGAGIYLLWLRSIAAADTRTRRHADERRPLDGTPQQRAKAASSQQRA